MWGRETGLEEKGIEVSWLDACNGRAFTMFVSVCNDGATSDSQERAGSGFSPRTFIFLNFPFLTGQGEQWIEKRRGSDAWLISDARGREPRLSVVVDFFLRAVTTTPTLREQEATLPTTGTSTFPQEGADWK